MIDHDQYELNKIYEGMVNVYGDDVPDPDVYPRCFQYLLKMYMTYHHNKESND